MKTVSTFDRCPFDSDKAFAIYTVLIKAYCEHSLINKLPLKPDCYEAFAEEAIHAASVFESAVDNSIEEILGLKK